MKLLSLIWENNIMKILKYSLLGILLLLVVAVVAAWLYLEPLVKGAVHKFGTQIVGTEVKLDGFSLNPFAGELEVKGLSVANPEGYSAPELLSLGRIFVKLDVKSLMSDTIVVEDITVNEPKITYEMPNLSTSNVMQIQENVAKNTASTESEATDNEVEEEVVAEEKSTKNVIIKKVLVDGGVLSAITPLQKNETALVLNMPAVELTGIGEEGQKMTIKESVVTIFNKILFNATSVVTKALGSASEIAQKAAGATLDGAKNAADAATDEAKGLLDKVKFW